MEDIIEILRLFTRAGWILLVFVIGLVVHELSSVNLRKRRKRFNNLLFFTIGLVATLITIDYFIATDLIRILSVLVNLVFLYGLSFYLLSFRYQLRKKVDLEELERTRRQIEMMIEQMKKPLVK